MTERLTEAAQLYCANLDVLDAARTSLLAYFDAVWVKCWDSISSDWPGEKTYSPHHWRENAEPGRWHVHLTAQRSGLEVLVSDPRRSGSNSQYLIELSTSAAAVQRLRKMLKGQALEHLDQRFSAAGHALEWSDNRHLCEQRIDLQSNSATETAGSLAEAINGFLFLIYDFEHVIAAETGTG